MRISARHLLTMLLVVLAAALTGCGADDDATPKQSGADRAGSKTTEDGGTELATIDAKLDIAIKQVASKEFPGLPAPAGIACTRSSPATCQGTVECPAAGGDTQRAELCAWIADTGAELLLTEPSQTGVCTQEYGGPEVATVSGTIDGEQVDATFARNDGCSIARYDEVSPLWTGEVPGATVTAGAGGSAAGSCPALDPDAPVSSDAADPAAGAADEVCATPAEPGPPKSAPQPEPEIISDPPEAFQ